MKNTKNIDEPERDWLARDPEAWFLCKYDEALGANGCTSLDADFKLAMITVLSEIACQLLALNEKDKK